MTARTCAHCKKAPATIGLAVPVQSPQVVPLHGEPMVECGLVWVCTPCLIEAGS